jgi:hypothetical protein
LAEKASAQRGAAIDDRNSTIPAPRRAIVELSLDDARNSTISAAAAGFVELWS